MGATIETQTVKATIVGQPSLQSNLTPPYIDKLISSSTYLQGEKGDKGDSADQVNSDWNATSGVAEILNKPIISGSNTGDNVYISGTALLDFGDENSNSISTISNIIITASLIKGVTFIPIETSTTSLDDFYLNGVSFLLGNIIDNTSFDIMGNSTNNASGIYTVKYIITL